MSEMEKKKREVRGGDEILLILCKNDNNMLYGSICGRSSMFFLFENFYLRFKMRLESV